jgi:hypothetical protein
MPENLEAVGLDLDITGIAVPENFTGAELVVDLKVGVQKMPDRGTPLVQIAVAAENTAGRPDQGYGEII